MTRIEEADEYRKEQYYTSNSQAFWDGFEWADEHPQTPWRQDYTEDELPKDRLFLLASEDGVVERCCFTPSDNGYCWLIYHILGVPVKFEYIEQNYKFWMPLELPQTR